MNYKRKDLLKLPERDWNKTTKYGAVSLVPTGKKHDSGYHLIAIVGYKDAEPFEIAAYCDDVYWTFNTTPGVFGLRTDMYYPSGITHVWGREIDFEVGYSLSSTEIIINTLTK